jgi:pimeloyl-ACP methyl ester carboxylesterase
MGISEGAPVSALFAATYPERTQALVLHGGMAKSTCAPDYPWATPADAVLEGAAFFEPDLFVGTDIEIWAPSLADDERAMAWLGRFRRPSIPPGVLAELFLMFLEIDVRAVCRRSPTRRWCSTGAVTGSSIGGRGSGWRAKSRERGMWSSKVRTISLGSAM